MIIKVFAKTIYFVAQLGEPDTSHTNVVSFAHTRAQWTVLYSTKPSINLYQSAK